MTYIKKFLNANNLKNLMKFLFSVFIGFIFIFIISALINGYTPISGNESYVLYAAISVSLTYFYFGKSKSYLITLLPLFVLFASAYLIRRFSGLTYDAQDFYRFAGFTLCIYNPLLIILRFVKNKIAHIFAAFVTFFITLLPIAILWGYWTITKKLMLPETFLAICQTDFTEAFAYMQGMFNSSIYVLFLLFPIIVLGLSILSYKKLVKNTNLPKYSVVIAILLLLLHGLLIFHTSRNSIAAPFIQTKEYMDKYREFAENKEARKQFIKQNLQTKDEKGVYVLIIGESQNRDHMQVYGYNRDTTPFLSSVKNDPHFIFFDHARSCHTQTVQVLTFALTAKNQYNRIQMKEAPSILEVANAAGYTTAWLSNQGKYGMFNTPITVIASDAKYQKFINETAGETKREWTEKVDKNRNRKGDYDENLVAELKNLPKTDKMLIVIHLMGNHTPYGARYPDGYDYYKGNDISIDKYDNSIRYTDEVLKNIYETAKEIPNFKGIIYFSDHTDAVDQGLAHDATLFVPEMTYIPMFMTFSDDYMQNRKETINMLKEHEKTYFTNDLIFNTLLSIMDIKLGSMYESTNDITKNSYDDDPHRFLTLYGKVEISKDPNFPNK